MGDMYSIQMAIWIAIDHPYKINRVKEDFSIVVPTPAEVEAVESNLKTVINGLSMFQINHPGMKGGALLNHMVGIRKHSYHEKQKDHNFSDAVHIRDPTKKHHKEFMRVDYEQVIEGNIMAYVGDEVNLKHAAR